MRATRRNMDWAHAQSSFQLVMVPDDPELLGEEYAADSGDYWTTDLDEDLGGELINKITVSVRPENVAEFTDLLEEFCSLLEAREAPTSCSSCKGRGYLPGDIDDEILGVNVVPCPDCVDGTVPA